MKSNINYLFSEKIQSGKPTLHTYCPYLSFYQGWRNYYGPFLPFAVTVLPNEELLFSHKSTAPSNYENFGNTQREDIHKSVNLNEVFFTIYYYFLWAVSIIVGQIWSISEFALIYSNILPSVKFIVNSLILSRMNNRNIA